MLRLSSATHSAQHDKRPCRALYEAVSIFIEECSRLEESFFLLLQASFASFLGIAPIAAKLGGGGHWIAIAARRSRRFPDISRGPCLTSQRICRVGRCTPHLRHVPCTADAWHRWVPRNLQCSGMHTMLELMRLLAASGSLICYSGTQAYSFMA